LIKWSGLCESYEAGLRGSSPGAAPPEIFDPNTEQGQARWKDLRSRVVEHVIHNLVLFNNRQISKVE
jgi:26S proteasome regulatory subunit N5